VCASTAYFVAAIRGVRPSGDGSGRELLVHWGGYSSNEDSWEPEENVDCDDLVQQLLKQQRQQGKSKLPKRQKLQQNRTRNQGRKRRNRQENQPDPLAAQFEVAAIRGVRPAPRGGEEYLVHWEGYPSSDDTWEPKANLSDVLLRDFHRRQQEAVVESEAEVNDTRSNQLYPHTSSWVRL
jgi:hypothetical protein